ncbi:MAG: hypothetical protein H6510_17120 [Acidobacteria bacterium]|nr:hypothetical protein [Acidobacteriota bacterium]
MNILLLALLWAPSDSQQWFLHYTKDGGGFKTDLIITNTSAAETLSGTLLPYAPDGTALTHLQKPVQLGPGQQVRLARFDLGWGEQGVSHGTLTSASPDLRLTYEIAQYSSQAMASLSVGRTEAQKGGQVTTLSQPGFWDGLVLVNATNDPADVVVSAYDSKGNTLQSRGIHLSGHAKWTGLISDLFPQTLDQQGYLRWRSELPIFAMGLRGSLNLQPAILTELSWDPVETPAPTLTYANQISRILRRNCEGCHRAGGIAPFSLDSYGQTAALKATIHQVVSEGIMPPWRAASTCQPLKDSQALDPVEKEMLLQWLAGAAERGDPARELTPLPPLETQWQAGNPDLVFQYGDSFSFPAGPDVYRCFPIELGNTQDIYMKGYEIQPGNPSIVHHVLLFVETANQSLDLDQAESGPGYTCFGGPGTNQIRLIGGWAPGMPPQFFPDTVGMTLKKNSKLIMQVHYHYGTTDGTDQTRFGLHLMDQKPQKELLLLPLVNDSFLIPANAKNYAVSQSITLPFFIPLDLYVIAPHMHLLGQTISVDSRLPDGTEQCLIDVPQWDFNWQRFYTFKDPISIPGGTTLTLHCTFDNSTDNPYNPSNPPIPVGWGEATTDEMALCFLGVTAPFDLINKNAPWTWPMQPQGEYERRLAEPERYQPNQVPLCCRPGAVFKAPGCQDR